MRDAWIEREREREKERRRERDWCTIIEDLSSHQP